MLIDGETGLVLCKSSETVIPQNELDELATITQEQQSNPIASAMLGIAPKAHLLSRTQIEKTTVTTVISSIGGNEDMLVCQFDSSPERSTLNASAQKIFDLASDAEAA